VCKCLPIRSMITLMATKASEVDKDQAMELVRAAAKDIVAGKAEAMGVVRCNNFQCFGVRGVDGIWRDVRGRFLAVIEVVRRF